MRQFTEIPMHKIFQKCALSTKNFKPQPFPGVSVQIAFEMTNVSHLTTMNSTFAQILHDFDMAKFF